MENESFNKSTLNKILYFYSVAISSKSCEWNENMKKILEKIIKIEEMLNAKEKKVAIDLCMMVPNSKEDIKLYLLEKIINDSHSEELNKKIIDIFFNFFREGKKEKDTLNQGMKLFSKFFMKNKLEKIFNKSQKKILIEIFSNKDYQNFSKEDLQMFFYVLFSCKEMCHYKSLGIADKISKNNELKTESEFISALGDYNKLFNFAFNKLEDIYGKKNTAEILMMAKPYAIKEFLIKSGKKDFTFEELGKTFNLDFFELEEFLVEGDNKALFKIKINYEKETAKVIYVKKDSYSKEEINGLKKDISNLKEKMENICVAIDKI